MDVGGKFVGEICKNLLLKFRTMDPDVQEFIIESINKHGYCCYENLPVELGKVFGDCAGSISLVTDRMIDMMQTWKCENYPIRWGIAGFMQESGTLEGHEWANEILSDIMAKQIMLELPPPEPTYDTVETEFWWDGESFKISVIHFSMPSEEEWITNGERHSEHVKFEKTISKDEMKEILTEILEKRLTIVIDGSGEELMFR